MASERYTLDANVLVYAVDITDPGRQLRAQDVIARSYGRDCVLTVQALGEFYTVVTRKRLLSRALAASMVVDWRRTFALAAANADSLMRAMIAERRYGLSFWDAMLWATVRASPGARLSASASPTLSAPTRCRPRSSACSRAHKTRRNPWPKLSSMTPCARRAAVAGRPAACTR
jgi:predicted nucleic acid-binding protein